MASNKEKIKCPDPEQFKNDVMDGMIVPELMEKYKVCHSLISRWRVEFGLGKVFPFKNLDKTQFADDCKTFTVAELMEKYKVSDNTIRIWKRNLDIIVQKPLQKTHEEFLIEVKSKHGDAFRVIGEYINSYTKISFLHISCGFAFEATPSGFMSYIGCPRCSIKERDKKIVKEHAERFEKHVEEKLAGEYVSLTKYLGGTKPIKMKHLTCGNIYTTTPANVINGHGCPTCGRKRNVASTTKSHDEFLVEFKSIYGDDYEVVGDYKNSYTSIAILHKECGEIYKKHPRTMLATGSLCPYCKTKSISNGEKKIEIYLLSKGLDYERQFSFEDCIGEKTLRFDFAVFRQGNLEALIEFDGLQHFKPIKYYGGVDTYQAVLKRDKIKNDYCKQNKIKLIRIPYYDFKNIESILDADLIN